MKFFSRWSRKKENLVQRETQRKQSEEKAAKPLTETPVEISAEQTEIKASRPNAAHRLLLKPLVTEKTTYLQSEGVYGFMVHPQANKIEIKKAVEAAFGVTVTGVRTINYQGKKVRYGRVNGQRKNWKKALVSLKKGDRIEIHKNV